MTSKNGLRARLSGTILIDIFSLIQTFFFCIISIFLRNLFLFAILFCHFLRNSIFAVLFCRFLRKLFFCENYFFAILIFKIYYLLFLRNFIFLFLLEHLSIRNSCLWFFSQNLCKFSKGPAYIMYTFWLKKIDLKLELIPKLDHFEFDDSLILTVCKRRNKTAQWKINKEVKKCQKYRSNGKHELTCEIAVWRG